jgi:hypothetical protein
MSLRAQLDRTITQHALGRLTEREYAHTLLGLAALAIENLEKSVDNNQEGV